MYYIVCFKIFQVNIVYHIETDWNIVQVFRVVHHIVFSVTIHTRSLSEVSASMTALRNLQVRSSLGFLLDVDDGDVGFLMFGFLMSKF